MSIERYHLQKEYSCQEKRRVMLAKLWINGLRKKCPRTLQVGYRKHMQQPLSEMSHTHRDFFGFITPPSVRRTQASTVKKCYNNEDRVHLATSAH
jgi:hypothetical protein